MNCAMYILNKNDYDDILNLICCCISCLKNVEKKEGMLYEMLKLFKADEAVFLSAKNNYEGVNLTNSYSICNDRSYLKQYADYFWHYDPLYKKQFYTTPNNLVFKTDDVIPYSQMVKLEYYNSFLRPQNLLGELIIRLYSKGKTFGVISLQRYKNHPAFEKKDVLKASLLAPYLVNIFETANGFKKINDERILFEQWMDSHSEGIILLDSEFKPIYINSKAKLFCLLLNGIKETVLYDAMHIHISIPQIIIQDCKNLIRPNDANELTRSHCNRIVGIKHVKRYYIQYFPIMLPSSERPMPHFVVFLNELTRYGENIEDILTEQSELSRREEIVAQYSALGLTNKQIAEKLCISPFTVHNHLKNIFAKTGLDNRTQLANVVKFSDSLLL
jgi:DNA-binding CsgD family transcriptional regulator